MYVIETSQTLWEEKKSFNFQVQLPSWEADVITIPVSSKKQIGGPALCLGEFVI